MIFNRLCVLILTLSVFGCTPRSKEMPTHVNTFIRAKIPHLDPIHSTNTFSSEVNSAIFEGLYHYDYIKRPIVVSPSLAESLPEVSKDKKTYTFKIKKGVLFHDDKAFANGKGRELSANDFVYSWKRLADPKNKALGWWVFDGLIDGLNEWRDLMRQGKATYDTPVSGLKVIDEHTLQVRLTRPSFQFIHYLCMPVTMVMAKEVVDHYGTEVGNNPVGTGPFDMIKWVRGSKIVLEKNPNYRTVTFPEVDNSHPRYNEFKAFVGKNLPLSKKIIVHIFPEPQPLWLSFQKGELDRGIVPKNSFEQAFLNGDLAPELKDKGMRLYKQYRPDVIFTGFNMEHPVLGKNKLLRQAMVAAINRPLIVKKFYNGRGVLAHGPIPPGLDAYDPNYKNPTSYDPERAKKLLVEAGFPGGKGLPTFEFQLSSNASWSRQYGEYLKDQWAKIGIPIKLVANTWPQFDKKIKEKKATIYELAWMADYPDSENFLQMFYSKNISPGSNSSNFINREFDAIFEKAILLPPGAERSQLFAQLVKIINEEAPVLFVVHRIMHLPYHSWLKNYNTNPIIYDYLQYFAIDVDEKQRRLKQL